MKKMIKKERWIMLVTVLSFCLTGCSRTLSPNTVVTDLNNILSDCVEERGEMSCQINKALQEYFSSVSNYRLINVANEPFLTVPSNPISQFSDTDIDKRLCDFSVALFFADENEGYYSVSFNCNEGNISSFVNANRID